VSAAVLLLTCPDRKGLVAAVSEFVYRHGGNILHADQHADEEAGLFLQRVEFTLDDLDLGRDEIKPQFDEVAQRFGMRFEIHFRDDVARVAVLLSREAHCMYDLLARWRTGEFPAEISIVVSNHPDHADAAAAFGVEYQHLPVTPETRPEQERALLRLLDEKAIDLVVLARYMQILGPEVIDRYDHRIINIHHSFLPAFAGPRPYHQAYERGVKLIGATAHYATAELDEGPIIGQDVAWVSHRDSVDDLIRKGRDLEKVVLARAVHQHLEHRVLVYQNRTVVFD
jgi:formyltetrahydrofolate deformylase